MFVGDFAALLERVSPMQDNVEASHSKQLEVRRRPCRRNGVCKFTTTIFYNFIFRDRVGVFIVLLLNVV